MTLYKQKHYLPFYFINWSLHCRIFPRNLVNCKAVFILFCFTFLRYFLFLMFTKNFLFWFERRVCRRLYLSRPVKIKYKTHLSVQTAHSKKCNRNSLDSFRRETYQSSATKTATPSQLCFALCKKCRVDNRSLRRAVCNVWRSDIMEGTVSALFVSAKYNLYWCGHSTIL